MDRQGLIRWGLEIVRIAAGGARLEPSAERWFHEHFEPAATRLADHPSVFERFRPRLAEHLERLGECAHLLSVERGGMVDADVMRRALAAMGERFGQLTSLCDPDPPPG